MNDGDDQRDPSPPPRRHAARQEAARGGVHHHYGLAERRAAGSPVTLSRPGYLITYQITVNVDRPELLRKRSRLFPLPKGTEINFNLAPQTVPNGVPYTPPPHILYIIGGNKRRRGDGKGGGVGGVIEVVVCIA